MADDREGLSPEPQNILDLFEDGDDETDEESFEPSSEVITEDGIEAMEEDEEIEFTDAQEELTGIIFQGQAEEEDEGEQTETGGQAEPRRTTAQVTISDINQLLSQHGPLRRLLLSRYRFISPGMRGLEDDDEEDDPDYDPNGNFGARRRRRRPKPTGDRFPKVPSEAGRELMKSGIYGSGHSHVDIRRKRRRTVSERLMWRRLGVSARGSLGMYNRLLAQEMVPATTLADKIIHYDSRAYSGHFSDDGNFFFSCTQNFKVRMYDTSNPYDWKYYKTVDYPFGQWTITDATLSPDNRYLAYSSIRHMVCLAPTDPTDESEHTLLDFTNFAPGAIMGRTNVGYNYMGRNGFGIWSLRFSGDGREIVAGTSDHSVVVYDIERQKSILKLVKHEDDVNAVCFGDKSSPHILYSGSDDQTLRVWDRRSMADGQPAGVFVGHTEGLTYVDSKGDGRYVLSNGKDQMMKLWDLRKMVSPSQFDKIDLHNYTTNFDYRFSPYDEDEYRPNPADCSVVTFRGHSVLKTLIRCHFSPPTSSNSRYVYSGSEDGKVWIWNMDATVKAKIDVGECTENTRPKVGNGGDTYGYDLNPHGSAWKTCVRDASWSPTAPVLAATSWNGWGMATGTVTLHSWNDGHGSDEGEPPMGANYNSRLDLRDDYRQARQNTRSRTGNGRGLRSQVVRPQRYGGGDEESAGGGGAW